jgi:class 3 adenylate cyclase
MTTLLVTHAVTDYQAWPATFEAGAPVRERHGGRVFRVMHDGAGVVGLIDFPDETAARAFLADPALHGEMAGVPAPPQIRILSEVTEVTGVPH